MDLNVVLAALPEIFTQIFGFVAVFIILKKYAFGTVFQVLDDRQKAITLSIDEFEQKKVEMESMKEDYAQKLHGIEQEAHLKLQAVINEGQQITVEIRDKARRDAAVQLEYARQEIQRETESARALVRKEVVELSALMAGKLITKNLSNEENETYVLKLLSNTGELV